MIVFKAIIITMILWGLLSLILLGTENVLCNQIGSVSCLFWLTTILVFAIHAIITFH